VHRDSGPPPPPRAARYGDIHRLEIDLDPRWEHPPHKARLLVAEDRVISAGHHGGEQMSLEPDCAVTNGINTGMNRVQPAHSTPMLDRAPFPARVA
jgi:hypothetical protein